MGYGHVFLFFLCVNFGLGMTTVVDTPLSIPTELERCFVQMNDNGPSNPNAPGGYFPYIVHGNGTVTEIGQQYVPGGAGITDSITDPVDPATGNFWDPVMDSVEIQPTVQDLVINFLSGGFVTDMLNHITLTCDLDPNSPTYGQPQFPEIWIYFTSGVQVIFSFMLFATIFQIVTGRTIFQGI